MSITVLLNNALRADSQKSYPTGLVDLEEADIRVTANTLKISSILCLKEDCVAKHIHILNGI